MASFAAGLLLLCAAQTQPPSQEQLKTNLENKLKAPFFSKAGWITDYDKARETAKADGKLIFAYFTRSYAK
jgi:hypothetical protein